MVCELVVSPWNLIVCHHILCGTDPPNDPGPDCFETSVPSVSDPFYASLLPRLVLTPDSDLLPTVVLVLTGVDFQCSSRGILFVNKYILLFPNPLFSWTKKHIGTCRTVSDKH
jgi:hypothetical protein